jgi:hypothetical protein
MKIIFSDNALESSFNLSASVEGERELHSEAASRRRKKKLTKSEEKLEENR